MSLFKRAAPDPITAAAVAEARTAEIRADVERVRLTAQLRREQATADREAARAAELAAEDDRRRRQDARRTERAASREKRQQTRKAFLAKAGPVAPLLLINGGAAYAQAAYAYDSIAPDAWDDLSSLAFALGFALALECIAVYIQWHAHDALLLKSYATAGKLRRASWLIAAVVAGINYAHFANGVQPTPAAVSFALLSLLSPWLWGLHTRRAQHVQLLAEDSNLVDGGGAEFSPDRRRAFPIRSWLAKRWSIDHGVRDPREAWQGYNAERTERRTARAARNTARAAARAVTKPAKKAAPLVPITGLDDLTEALPSPEVDRPAPVKRTSPKSLTNAEKVAKVAAKMPHASNAMIAAKAGVSLSTVTRHRPRPASLDLPPAGPFADAMGVDPGKVTAMYDRMGYDANGVLVDASPSGPDAAETATVQAVNGQPVDLIRSES